MYNVLSSKHNLGELSSIEIFIINSYPEVTEELKSTAISEALDETLHIALVAFFYLTSTQTSHSHQL